MAARRSGSEASSETGASGVRAISPSTSTMSGPRSAGGRRGCVVGRAAAEAPLGRRGGVPEPAPAPDVVADPGDLAARRRDGQHQRVGVGEAERRRHLVLVLQQQLVVLALGQAVELDADVGEECRRAPRATPGRRSRPAGGRTRRWRAAR